MNKLSDMSLQDWLHFSSKGRKVKFSSLKDVGNIDTNIMNLEKDKIKRATKHISKGNVEMPIVLKLHEEYDLLCGNTRLALLLTAKEEPYVYLLDIKDKKD